MSNEAQYHSHFRELKQRVTRLLIAYGIILCPLIYFSQSLYTFLAQPLLKTLPQGSHIIATTVVAPFMIPLKLAFIVSLILLIPYLFYHIWAFIAPGLFAHEKKMIFPVLCMSVLLFYGGMAFAHLVVCPMALGFFTLMAPQGVMVMTDMAHYLDFVFSLYLAFGIAFQIPLVVFLACQLGLLSIETLEKSRPYTIVAAFIVGMLLTPPDVISQILLAVPLLILFELGLWLAKRAHFRHARENRSLYSREK